MLHLAHAIPVLKPTQNQASTSRAGTPSSLGDGKLVNGFTANGSSSAGNIKMEGDQNLPCVICTRTVCRCFIFVLFALVKQFGPIFNLYVRQKYLAVPFRLRQVGMLVI